MSQIKFHTHSDVWCVAMILGAGRGRRMGSSIPKQYISLGRDNPMRRSLKVFYDHPEVNDILPIIHADDINMFEETSSDIKIMSPVIGGNTRQESVRAGLNFLSTLTITPEIVLIHDSVRPFVTQSLISSVIFSLKDNVGVIPALPITDTVKKSCTNRKIHKTLNRSKLWRTQTPQGFRFNEILAAHEEFKSEKVSDDSEILEYTGAEIALIDGEEANIKITTPEDFKVLGINQQARETRIGQGFDAHRFGPGHSLSLCGVLVPHEYSLEGHSDADVALHALTDAILGAMSEGDIGTHFPSSNEEIKGLESKVFLKKAMHILEKRGGTLTNVDITIICEVPKINASHQKMVKNVSDILCISEGRVSIKATTTDGMGFTGRREGIAAQAIATIII